MQIEDLIREAHETATSKGWWQMKPERTFGDQIALMHSELSEALEEFRRPLRRMNGEDFNAEPMALIWANLWGAPVRFNANDSDISQCKPEGIAIEFADVMIRIFDTCARYEIPLVEAIKIKMAFNKTREHKHGGKAI
jgi:hypothetical protein